MSSLNPFSSNTPVLSPMIQQASSVTKLQKAEEERAKQAKIEETQDQLRIQTQLRNRRSGIRGLLFGGANPLTSLLGSG